MLVHKLSSTVTVGLDPEDGFTNVLFAFTEDDTSLVCSFFASEEETAALPHDVGRDCLVLDSGEVRELQKILNVHYPQQGAVQPEQTQYDRFVAALDGVVDWDSETVRKVATEYGITGLPAKKTERYKIGGMQLVAPFVVGSCVRLYFDSFRDGVSGIEFDAVDYDSGVIITAMEVCQLRDALTDIIDE